jgi:hypothetical protein
VDTRARERVASSLADRDSVAPDVELVVRFGSHDYVAAIEQFLAGAGL